MKGSAPISALFALAVLAACTGRLPMVGSLRDKAGHTLLLFKDSLFIARVGDDGQQFYRPSQRAFGYYRFEQDSTLVLNSKWERRVRAWLVPDSMKMTSGLAVRFVDRRDLSDGNSYKWMNVYDDRDSLLTYNYGYDCWFSDRWSPWIRVEDTWGMIEVDTVALPDTSRHWHTVKFDWFSLDHDGELIILQALRLGRVGSKFVPRAAFNGHLRQDPVLDTLTPWLGMAKEKRVALERMAWRLKKRGWLPTIL